jgi:nucleoside-diphosphate-sugar epimerase
LDTTLVTGASGFLGNLIKRELDSKNRVVTLGRDMRNDVKADLRSDVPLLNQSFDIVVHAAGKAHITPKTDSEKKAFFDVNLQGTKNLLRALEKSTYLPKKFLFISTVSVYGKECGINISEESPLLGQTSYALSKAQAEWVLETWCRENKVTLSILRLPLVVASHAPGNLGRMISGIKTGRYFGIGSNNAKKSMVMATDVAAAIPVVANIGGVYNLTDGYHPSFTELEQLIAKQLGRKPPRHIPEWSAKLLAKTGDIIPGFPFNSSVYNKMTATLTFDDTSARKNWGWNPKRVLDSFVVNDNR